MFQVGSVMHNFKLSYTVARKITGSSVDRTVRPHLFSVRISQLARSAEPTPLIKCRFFFGSVEFGQKMCLDLN